MKLRSRFPFFASECPVAPDPFVEKALLPPSNCFCAFARNQLDVFVWWIVFKVWVKQQVKEQYVWYDPIFIWKHKYTYVFTYSQWCFLWLSLEVEAGRFSPYSLKGNGLLSIYCVTGAI